jgi:hypothetical protein
MYFDQKTPQDCEVSLPYKDTVGVPPSPALRTGPSWPTPFIQSFFPPSDGTLSKKRISSTTGAGAGEQMDESCAMPELQRHHSLFDSKDNFTSDNVEVCRDFDWQEEDSRLTPPVCDYTSKQSESETAGRQRTLLHNNQHPQSSPIMLQRLTNQERPNVGEASKGQEHAPPPFCFSMAAAVMPPPVKSENKKMDVKEPPKQSSFPLGEHSSAIIDAALSERSKEIIINPTDSDILLGRGNLANYHE